MATQNNNTEAAQIIYDGLAELAAAVEATSPNTDSWTTGQSLTDAMSILAHNIGRIASVMEKQTK